MKIRNLARVFVTLALAFGIFLAARGLSMASRPVASSTPQVVAWLVGTVPGPTTNVNWNG